jgi:hypothetical protein
MVVELTFSVWDALVFLLMVIITLRVGVGASNSHINLGRFLPAAAPQLQSRVPYGD